MTASMRESIYYDPFDFAVDEDPYPVFAASARRDAAVPQ